MGKIQNGGIFRLVVHESKGTFLYSMVSSIYHGIYSYIVWHLVHRTPQSALYFTPGMSVCLFIPTPARLYTSPPACLSACSFQHQLDFILHPRHVCLPVHSNTSSTLYFTSGMSVCLFIPTPARLYTSPPACLSACSFQHQLDFILHLRHVCLPVHSNTSSACLSACSFQHQLDFILHPRHVCLPVHSNTSSTLYFTPGMSVCLFIPTPARLHWEAFQGSFQGSFVQFLGF